MPAKAKPVARTIERHVQVVDNFIPVTHLEPNRVKRSHTGE